jgi:hypothetical protein
MVYSAQAPASCWFLLTWCFTLKMEVICKIWSFHGCHWIMLSSEMLHCVAPVKTNFSEEHSTSVIRVTRSGELRARLAVTNNRRTVQRNVYYILVTANVPSSLILVTLMMEVPHSSETSVLTRTTRRNISEDGIPHEGDMFLQNVGSYVVYMALYPRRWQHSWTMLNLFSMKS